MLKCDGFGFANLLGHARFKFLKRYLIGVAKIEPMSAVKGEPAMTTYGLIGSVALSLALATTPVMAMHVHHHYGHFNAFKYHYGSTYAAYNFYRGYDFARRNTFN